MGPRGSCVQNEGVISGLGFEVPGLKIPAYANTSIHLGALRIRAGHRHHVGKMGEGKMEEQKNRRKREIDTHDKHHRGETRAPGRAMNMRWRVSIIARRDGAPIRRSTSTPALKHRMHGTLNAPRDYTI
jgi:hypothetical protein